MPGSDLEARLIRPNQEVEDPAFLAGPKRLEMPVAQPAVPRHPVIDDSAVQGRADPDKAGPVQGGDPRLMGRQDERGPCERNGGSRPGTRGPQVPK